MEADPTARTRALNDRLRRTHLGGTLMFTSGINALSMNFTRQALIALAEFDSFDPDNYPHGEHDFGTLTVQGERLIWKIDYYADASLSLGSDNPSEEAHCYRILTLMLAEEY